jgi:hypothetical protein
MGTDLLTGRTPEELKAEVRVLDTEVVLQRQKEHLEYANLFLSDARALFHKYPLENDLSGVCYQAERKVGLAQKQVEATQRMLESRIADLRSLRDASGT